MVSVSEEVSTAGLDLTKASDRQRLESRIRSATRRVCGDNGLVGMVKDERLCRKAAQVSAQRQVASLLDRSRRLANAAGQPIEIRTSVAVAAPSDD
jgi:UrcA family protein